MTMYVGIILHVISKMSFIVGSYAMHFFLGRYLSEAEYGIVGTIITIMNFEYIFFTDGVRQGMAKSISMEKYREKDLIKTGVLFQLGIVGVFFAATYFGASTIADVLNDARLVPYIRQLAWLLPFTGIYSLSLGILNGHKDFKSEAVIGMIYPVLKLSVIPFVLFVCQDAVLGTELGFLFAAVTIMIISLIQVFRRRSLFYESDIRMEGKEYVKTALNYLLLFCVSTIMMNLDTLILKSVSRDNEIVGYYTGVATFAKIPYYLLTAFYTVALPVVTREYHAGKLKKAEREISSLMTIIFALVFPVITIISAAAPQILSLFYRPSYKRGGNALSFLVFAIAFLGMTLIFTMVLSAADKKRHIAWISIAMICLQAGLAPVLTYYYSLTGTAFATFVTAGVGMLASGFFAVQTFGMFLERKHMLTLLGNLAAFLVFYGFFHTVSFSHFFVLGGACGICYVLAAGTGAWKNRLRLKRK